MNLKSFESLIKTERSATRYINRSCWKNYRRFCIRCDGRKIYALRHQRYRCKRCGYEFSDWTGRWIGQLRISAKPWLWLLKLFELEVSALKACHPSGLSYPTVLKAFTVIRKAIVAQSKDAALLLRGEIETDETYFGGRRKGNRGWGAARKVPVFGILERGGGVKVEVVPNVDAETLMNLTVKRVRWGSLLYTDKFRSDDALMCCGYRHLRVDHRKRFSSGKLYINSLEGFWAYAKERLIKHHGVSQKHFPLYLKEMEFRYNYRHEPLFDLLLNLITKPVANLL
ncbi:MAG: IS1595 family transposase [Candidatus Methanomethylicaceae archaeon]